MKWERRISGGSDEHVRRGSSSLSRYDAKIFASMSGRSSVSCLHIFGGRALRGQSHPPHVEGDGEISFVCGAARSAFR